MESGVTVKTFQLVEVLAGTAEGLALGDIAAAAELAKPTAHRILGDLAKLGYVIRQPGGTYRLSSKFRHLGLDPGHRRLISLADPILQELHQSVGQETVNLAVPRRDGIEYVAVRGSVHPLQRVVNVNETAPYDTSALGRVIVAHWPTERQEFLLAQAGLASVALDPDAFRALLRGVKEDGYAVELNQADQGVGCAAAPVFEDDDPVAAISVSVPLARVDERQLRGWVSEVCKAAAGLSRLLTPPRKAVR